jgi:hypothetical protein
VDNRDSRHNRLPFFQAELLKSLKDCNREVRAAGARTLLAGGIDLTNELGPDWRNVLEAYKLLGQYRFMELAKLGHAAYLAPEILPQ